MSRNNKKRKSNALAPVIEEIDLPRGGGDPSVIPLKFKKEKTENDDLFGQEVVAAKSSARKKRKINSNLTPENSTNLKGSSKTEFVEFLNFHVISLPNQMKGTVQIINISDQLTEIANEVVNAERFDEKYSSIDLSNFFKIGQWVRCVIIELERRDEMTNDKTTTKHKPHKVIGLSLSPKEVNRDIEQEDLVKGLIIAASVRSVEDHGYILDIGMKNINCFLNTKNSKNYEKKFNDNRPLSVGQVLNVSILHVKRSHFIEVTADPDILSNSILSEKNLHNINSLTPGNMVKARVDNVVQNGIFCNVIGINCEIDTFHMGKILSEENLEDNNQIKIGDEICARIIFVSITNESKKIRLSIVPHVLRLEYINNDNFPIGTNFLTITIKKIMSSGLIVKIDNSNIPGYIHISRVSDNHIKSLPESNNDFEIGSTHSVRVIGYSSVDGLLLLSMQKSVLDQKYLRHEDGTIQKILENGILIALSDNIIALAPRIHLGDTIHKHFGKKFELGQVVKCRVLNVEINEFESKIWVTLRNSLLDPDLPIINSYQEAEVGMITRCTITGVIGRGCHVSFFGNAHAFVPADQCDVNSQNIKEHFVIGQIVKCRIKSVMKDKKSMLATFRINDPTNTDISEIKIGDLVKGKIIQTKDDVIMLSLVPSQIRAVLPITHLSDHLTPTHLSKVVDKLKQDEVLKNLLVISRNEDKCTVTVSAKPILIKAVKAEKLPQSLEEVEVGSIIPGYIKIVKDYAVFVNFLGNFSAKAMRHNIADHFVASPVGIFSPNQSVLCHITSINSETSRCEVSLKPSDTNDTTSSSFPSYLKEGDFIKTYFAELQENKYLEEPPIKIGDRVKCQVKERTLKSGIMGFTAKVLLNGNGNGNIDMEAFINEDHANTYENIKEGDIIYGIVLDMDIKKKTVDLGIRPDLVNSKKINGIENHQNPISSHNKKLKKFVDTEENFDAIIELIKEDYIIVSLPDLDNVIAFSASKNYNNRSQPFMKYKFEQRTKAKIVYVPRNRDPNYVKIHGTISRVLITIQLPSEERLSITNDTKSIEDFSPGQLIEGNITGIEKYGIFMKIKDTGISGLCHISKLSDDYVKEISELYKIGQNVKAVVLEVNRKNQKIYFGLKASCFQLYNLELPNDSSVPDKMMIDDDECEINLEDKENHQESKNINDEMIISDETGNTSSTTIITEVKPLPFFSTWKWGNENDDNNLFKVQNGQNDQNREINLLEDKTEDLQNQKPEADEDFERLLLTSPNSSFLWINYMAHQLNLSEIDKAREIGERALKTINFREEQEKLNIWISLLNLENTFGTDESLANVFKLWTKMGLFHIQNGNIQAFRDLLQRCLNILPKRKNVKTITQFAKMEFKYGEAERGRTIFEGMMSNYPKRVDLWSIYIDMEVKVGDPIIIRRLFERITGMKFSSKKMKFFFKKWLNYEKEHGDVEKIEKVKQKAQDFAESLNLTSNNLSN
ncbi:4110_t:CDS:10 [Diversispora eburnea]|uniref:4110_t:CDS:1 n=1 Tax=Diversispora eburnea TaxID=1213867 RepID=A0A9N8VB21_9GLOM|nr:4110_t:CDS:10 [Diversispora eburnea]